MVLQQVRTIIAILSGRTVSEITPATCIQNDLGMDSLGIINLFMAIEEHFSIEMSDNLLPDVHSCDSFVVTITDSVAQGLLTPQEIADYLETNFSFIY